MKGGVFPIRPQNWTTWAHVHLQRTLYTQLTPTEHNNCLHNKHQTQSCTITLLYPGFPVNWWERLPFGEDEEKKRETEKGTSSYLDFEKKTKNIPNRFGAIIIKQYEQLLIAPFVFQTNITTKKTTSKIQFRAIWWRWIIAKKNTTQKRNTN